MPKPNQVREILHELRAAYELPEPVILEVMRETFSEILSRWYGAPMLVHFQGDGYEPRFELYRQGVGEVRQQEIPAARVQGWNTIDRQIRKHLLDQEMLHALFRYKRCERQAVWGEIIRRMPGGTLYAELSLIHGERVIGTCESRCQGPHERNSRALAVGARRAFWVRKIVPVFDRDAPRISIFLDRVSKNLPCGLILQMLPPESRQIVLRSRRRIVGARSEIDASEQLPRPLIRALSDELQEFIKVRVVPELRHAGLH